MSKEGIPNLGLSVLRLKQNLSERKVPVVGFGAHSVFKCDKAAAVFTTAPEPSCKAQAPATGRPAPKGLPGGNTLTPGWAHLFSFLQLRPDYCPVLENVVGLTNIILFDCRR